MGVIRISFTELAKKWTDGFQKGVPKNGNRRYSPVLENTCVLAQRKILLNYLLRHPNVKKRLG